MFHSRVGQDIIRFVLPPRLLPEPRKVGCELGTWVPDRWCGLVCQGKPQSPRGLPTTPRALTWWLPKMVTKAQGAGSKDKHI